MTWGLGRNKQALCENRKEGRGAMERTIAASALSLSWSAASFLARAVRFVRAVLWRSRASCRRFSANAVAPLLERMLTRFGGSGLDSDILAIKGPPVRRKLEYEPLCTLHRLTKGALLPGGQQRSLMYCV